MPIDPSWFNPFGANVATAGMNPVPTGVMADAPATGNGIFGVDRNLPKRDALAAMAATLLSGSGWSPHRQATSEILGRALLAGRQAAADTQDRIMKRQAFDQQMKLQQAQLNQLQNPTTNDIREYEYAKQNGYNGTFDQWQMLRLSGRAEPPASIQEFNLAKSQGFKGSLEDWLRTRALMTPINPSIVTVGNIPSVVQPTRTNPTAPIVTPLSNPAVENDAARNKAAATAAGTAEGEKTAKVPALSSLRYVANEIVGDDKTPGALDATPVGGPFGVVGALGGAFDYQDAKRFDNLREQLSTEMRTVFRIPGEDTLSDKEQAQYGLQLPDRKYSPEVNRAIVNDIVNRAEIRLTPGGTTGAQGPARIKSDAEYDSLPSGTVFIGPDGKQRRKP